MTCTSRIPSVFAATVALCTGLAWTVAQAETPMGVKSLAQAKADYQHDLAACRKHTVDEDLKTCRHEAEQAYADAKREAAAAHGGKSKSHKAKSQNQSGNEQNAPEAGK